MLNKVNKAPPAATGVDGKVTEHACLHEIIFYFIFLTQPVAIGTFHVISNLVPMNRHKMQYWRPPSVYEGQPVRKRWLKENYFLSPSIA